jgi:hypothetical protein
MDWELWDSIELPSNILEDNIDGFKKKEFLYKFSIDTWVDELQEYTFDTQVLPLSPKEGEAILKANSYYTSRRTRVNEITQKEVDLLKDIEWRLDVAIKKYGASGAFIKLSHRSPKDVAADKDNEKTKSIFKRKLHHVDSQDTNRQGIAWVAALNESMRVTSGKEALELLVKSYRIREDLITDIEYPDFFKSKLVVRKFVPVDISMEFRAFVSKGKITALSQYESGLYFRKLAPKKDTIQNEILALFEKIKDKIRLQSYVIDLVIVDDKVLIIELNPFHSNTSACLFSWKHDREIILNGPFTFRIVEAPIETDVLHDALPKHCLDIVGSYYKTPASVIYWTQGLIALSVLVVGANLFLYQKRQQSK